MVISIKFVFDFIVIKIEFDLIGFVKLVLLKLILN